MTYLSKLIDELCYIEQIAGNMKVKLGSNPGSKIHLNYSLEEDCLYIDDDIDESI